jgi:predicted SprT family Zn-dependent metalloprotease
MSFDDIISDFHAEQDKPITPEIVGETFDAGNKLINEDYLPQISKIKELKKYIADYKEMNLYKRGWRFNFGASKDWAGLCSGNLSDSGKSTKGRNIYISIEVTKHDENWKKNMNGIILHEIAHAVILEIFHFDKRNEGVLHRIDDQHKATTGHGRLWKSVCHALNGTECRISYEGMKTTEAFKDYRYDCPSCGLQGFGDSPKFTSSCKSCGTAVIVEPNIF